MKGRSSLLCVLAVAILLTAAANSAFGQGTSFAQLSGTVLDDSGRAVVGAAISLRDMDTNRTYPATTNDVGFFVIPSLSPGRYELKISFTGFAKYTQTGIVLSVGQYAALNVTLKVASGTEVVNVTTEVPPVEPTRTEVSQVIDTKQIASLPISGRLFTDFALLTPGVATGRTSLGSTFNEFEVTRISFGGQRDFSNTITVDGADNTNTATGSQRASPPQEAVSEFRVVNNSFGAEYGRALGGIVNIVTKSGGNDFHGSVYDYLQNNAFNARPLLIPSPQDFALRQNQFGATLGGPISKDRTFFFLNYEGQRRGEAPTYPPVFLNNLALIQAAKALMTLPAENLGVLKTRDHDYGVGRVDHQFSNNHRLMVRYNVEDARDLNALVGNTLDGGGIGTPSGGRNIFIRDQSLVSTLNSLLKPNLVNTALFQYARRHYNFPGATGEPDLSLPNQLEFGHNFGVLDAIYESRVQFSDSMAWVKGKHSMKFGFDYNHVRNYVVWPGFTPTRIILPGINCLVDFANFVNAINPNATPDTHLPSNPGEGPCPVGSFPFFPANDTTDPTNRANENDFLNGDPATFWAAPIGPIPGSSVNGTIPPPIPTTWENAFLPDQLSNFEYRLNHGYYGWFFQDQWRVTPKFTVNYGLRYDFETGLGRVFDGDYNGVQPRIGFAYSPDPKTVIRAGFGIFDDRQNLTFVFITGPQRPAEFPVPLLFTQQGSDLSPYALNILQPGAAAALVPGYGFPAQVAANIVLNGVFPPQYVTGTCDPFANLPGLPLPATSNCFTNAGGLEKNSPMPYSEQASLEIDRAIGKGLTVGIGYLFVGGHKLVRGNNLNMGCPVGMSKPGNPIFAQGILNPDGSQSACEGTPNLSVLGKPIFAPNVGAGVPTVPPPSFAVGPGAEFVNSGLLDYNNNVVSAIYHGLTFQVAEKVGKILRLNANYTFSKTIDDGTFTTFISLPQNQFDYPAERSLSNQDVRHRFVGNFVLDGPEKGLFRQFQLSGIVTLQSGRPFTLFVGFDANNDANPVTDRVELSGRNTYTGDGLYTADLHLSRYFKFGERHRIELGIDAFNLFNRPNVDEVASVYGAPGFCGSGIPRRYKDAASLEAQQVAAFCPAFPAPEPPIPFASPVFGSARTVFNPRQLQFSIKYSF